jgi:hypothetical protein
MNLNSFWIAESGEIGGGLYTNELRLNFERVKKTYPYLLAS